MEVEVARYAGACYGVTRALKMTFDAIDEHETVHTLGPLIHNPRVVSSLAERGIEPAETLDEIEGGAVVIRSHGAAPQVIEEAASRGLAIVDATCPYVSNVHTCAKELAEDGYAIVIVGEPNHPEVEGICAWAGDALFAVVDAPEDLPEQLPARVGVVVQTTQERATFDAVVDKLQECCEEVETRMTICGATAQRQDAARELSARCDVMIVIGGRNSGNTKRLVQICSANCTRTHHIEDAAEIEEGWLEGAELVGISAGASTPKAHIDAVVDRLQELQD
ncbi:MAG: 4-hydroxy-3-methylbut-2-enyl diphosphate reductase [Coriobacteriaceae bacterium]|nr:4-hydroxy-3-methylbut-2-enyl diphosphate reductase [Coriobacteriaceae bacterium]